MTSDEQAITNVLADYAHLVDSGDFDGAAGLWIPEGVMRVFNRDVVGRAAIAEFLAGAYRGKHLGGAPAMAIDSDRATVRSGYAFWLASDLSLSSLGRYEDTFVHADEGWSLEHRKIVIEFPARPSPSSE